MEHVLKTDMLIQLAKHVYSQMRTEDLLSVLHNLRCQKTLFDQGVEKVLLAVPLEGREEFRRQLISGDFISEVNNSILLVKRELATRPHVPNKQERRKLRQEKAKRSRSQSKSRNK